MTTIKAGEIWVAAIPFTNGISSKKRPVLILWLDGADVVLAAVTSALPRTQTRCFTKRLGKQWFTSRINSPFITT
jgi:mRNA interferase MazF